MPVARHSSRSSGSPPAAGRPVASLDRESAENFGHRHEPDFVALALDEGLDHIGAGIALGLGLDLLGQAQPALRQAFDVKSAGRPVVDHRIRLEHGALERIRCRDIGFRRAGTDHDADADAADRHPRGAVDLA